jgi:hypothetical protein
VTPPYGTLALWLLAWRRTTGGLASAPSLEALDVREVPGILDIREVPDGSSPNGYDPNSEYAVEYGANPPLPTSAKTAAT